MTLTVHLPKALRDDDRSDATIYHLWLRARSPGTAARITTGSKPVDVATSRDAHDFIFVALTAADVPGGHFSWDDRTTEVSCIYGFEPATVMQTGIRVLHLRPEAQLPKDIYRQHFTAPFGWINDPNGFVKAGDTYHLFYQHYPHALIWNTMHWGHATSTDLIHWVHQPVALLPDPTQTVIHGGHGGVFSGSAMPLPSGNGLRIYFTDSARGRTPAEYLRITDLHDGATAAGSHRLITPDVVPGHILTDFRDPYVFRGPGGMHMVVASRTEAGAAVLHFRSSDDSGQTGWRFSSVLFCDARLGITVPECPCLVPLDGEATDPDTLWVLIYAQLSSTDPLTGRRNMTNAVVGHFDGDSFTPKFAQDLDFGTSAYAFQALLAESGPVAIAWMANWTDFDRVTPFPSAMTLPRDLRLSADGNALLTPPIAAVTTLRRAAIDLGSGSGALPDGCAEFALDLAQGTPFRLDLIRDGQDVSVVVSAEGLEIIDTASGPARYLVAGAAPTDLRIFVDVGSVEVYANGGRWTGTRRVDPGRPFTAFRLSGSSAAARAWALAPITLSEPRHVIA
jgi:beta-fructofuranosidase